MAKFIKIKIKKDREIYHELALALSPYKEEKAGSIIFIVEGNKNKPVIGIRYPGRKLVKRELRLPRKNSVLWANLYDFEVVPYEKGREIETQKFTYEELIKDFEKNK